MRGSQQLDTAILVLESGMSLVWNRAPGLRIPASSIAVSLSKQYWISNWLVCRSDVVGTLKDWECNDGKEER